MINSVKNSTLLMICTICIPLCAMEIPYEGTTVNELALIGQKTENTSLQTQGRLSKLVESAENGDLIAQLKIGTMLLNNKQMA